MTCVRSLTASVKHSKIVAGSKYSWVCGRKSTRLDRKTTRQQSGSNTQWTQEIGWNPQILTITRPLAGAAIRLYRLDLKQNHGIPLEKKKVVDDVDGLVWTLVRLVERTHVYENRTHCSRRFPLATGHLGEWDGVRLLDSRLQTVVRTSLINSEFDDETFLSFVTPLCQLVAQKAGRRSTDLEAISATAKNLQEVRSVLNGFAVGGKRRLIRRGASLEALEGKIDLPEARSVSVACKSISPKSFSAQRLGALAPARKWALYPCLLHRERNLALAVDSSKNGSQVVPRRSAPRTMHAKISMPHFWHSPLSASWLRALRARVPCEDRN